MTLDDLRARFPALGFMLCAFSAEQPVSLEIHFTSGEYHTLESETAAGVIEQAAALLIPPTEPVEPEDIFG